jgi:sortase A
LYYFESALIVVGGLLCAWYAVAQASGEIGRRADLTFFSEQRKRDYVASLAQDIALPVAVLTIPSIRLEVPVYPTDSELHLNRGVGLIAGMAAPDHGGNIGIAGHRDGFFRRLANIKAGDLIELRTQKRLHQYRVAAIQIVDPEATHVLADTQEPVLTLVTCYPFYFLGHAPQRYVVRASYEWASKETS